MDSLPRPEVTPERYRELEMSAWQCMMMANATCRGDMQEMLIIKDLCINILRRWLADERMIPHEIAARQGAPLMAERDGNIIHLRPAGQD